MLENLNSLSYGEFLALIIIGNILMYLFTWLIVRVLRKFFIQFNLNKQNTAMSFEDLKNSLVVLFMNIFVGILGFEFLRRNFIILTEPTLQKSLLDLIVIFIFMDLAMYLTHLGAHHQIFYKHFHGVHHSHIDMAELSLYVMHPLEAFGFGVMLIIFLIIYPISLGALLIFLLFNWLFGVFAHSGIEPSKGRLGNYICMTKFHQIHHQRADGNYGFYTPLWDMLFKTRIFN